ncbi:MAG: hypothetical protein JWL81_2564 [Verrucomicrobiales bacterium]|nr:hypothetical protein [Verrucomicrobiales bacterium]
MKKSASVFTQLPGFTAVAIATAAVLFSGAQDSRAALAIGLTGTGLIQFNTDSPGTTSSSVLFSGLGADTIVDIDYRPSDGQLYGIASSGRLYTINPATGSAAINTSVGVGALGVVQDADFNPVANRLRVSSTNNANYRLTPGSNDPTAVTTDGIFSYQAGDVNFGNTPNLRANAYTNSFAGSAVTTLYSIDSEYDTLVIHNTGPQFNSLATVGDLNLTGLFIDFGNNVGFDILASGGLNTGYITNNNFLYEIDLGTGDLVPLGAIGGPAGGPAITSLAVIPEPASAFLSLLSLGALVLRRKR